MAEKLQASDLAKQASAILKMAEEKGISTNFFFATTFERYQTQMTILEGLKKVINDNGYMVEKSYISGKSNMYTNPAIADYNKTATAANQTVATLIKIVNSFTDEKKQTSKLAAFMKEMKTDD